MVASTLATDELDGGGVDGARRAASVALTARHATATNAPDGSSHFGNRRTRLGSNAISESDAERSSNSKGVDRGASMRRSSTRAISTRIASDRSGIPCSCLRTGVLGGGSGRDDGGAYDGPFNTSSDGDGRENTPASPSTTSAHATAASCGGAHAGAVASTGDGAELGSAHAGAVASTGDGAGFGLALGGPTAIMRAVRTGSNGAGGDAPVATGEAVRTGAGGGSSASHIPSIALELHSPEPQSSPPRGIDFALALHAPEPRSRPAWGADDDGRGTEGSNGGGGGAVFTG